MVYGRKVVESGDTRIRHNHSLDQNFEGRHFIESVKGGRARYSDVSKYNISIDNLR